MAWVFRDTLAGVPVVEVLEAPPPTPGSAKPLLAPPLVWTRPEEEALDSAIKGSELNF